MRLLVLDSIALSLLMVGLIAFFVASPVTDVPTGEAGGVRTIRVTESPTPKTHTVSGV